jgi:alginate O-acetyltransferase complex protein AlgI
MNFISLTFLAFLFFALMVYYLLPKRMQWGWLLAASLFFYLCFDVRYVAFLALSVLTSYGAARYMAGQAAPGRRRAALWGAIGLNVGLLVFLKYFNYSVSLLNLLAQRLGIPMHLYGLELIVPIGISFYTLQIVGYLVDVYRGRTAPERNLAKYALFVSFFPQILQGPIPRFDQLAPQLCAPHRFEYVRFKGGL